MVMLTGTSSGAVMRQDGSFSLVRVPTGSYTIRACAPGYLCASLTIETGAGVPLSQPGPDTLRPEWIRAMAKDAIVFAAANPIPEIWPWDAREAGADGAGELLDASETVLQGGASVAEETFGGDEAPTAEARFDEVPFGSVGYAPPADGFGPLDLHDSGAPIGGSLSIPAPAAAAPRHYHDSAAHYKVHCPECDGPLALQEGCRKCHGCGWSAC